MSNNFLLQTLLNAEQDIERANSSIQWVYEQLVKDQENLKDIELHRLDRDIDAHFTLMYFDEEWDDVLVKRYGAVMRRKESDVGLVLDLKEFIQMCIEKEERNASKA